MNGLRVFKPYRILGVMVKNSYFWMVLGALLINVWQGALAESNPSEAISPNSANKTSKESEERVKQKSLSKELLNNKTSKAGAPSSKDGAPAGKTPQSKIRKITVEGQTGPKTTERRLPTVEERLAESLEKKPQKTTHYKGSARTECQANCRGPACCQTVDPEAPGYLAPSTLGK